MRFWLDMGCDGFRVDMASSLIKNDEDSKGNMALWRKIRTFLDEKYPEAVLLSEWMVPDRAINGGFHMDFCPELFRKEKPYFSSASVHLLRRRNGYALCGRTYFR